MQPSISPKWSNTTKLIVGLSFLAIIGFLFSRFQSLLAPLLITFILTYLMYPPSNWMMRKLRMNWRLAVTLCFLILLLIILGLLTWGGLALVEQGQSLVAFLEKAIVDLPTTIQNFLNTPLAIGPFKFELYRVNLDAISSQVTSAVQPMLGNLGNILGQVASGTATTIGWLLFVMMMAYFILAETGGQPDKIFHFDIPGYEDDFKNIGLQLNKVWNAFLRGQFLIIAFVIFVYSILFGAVGLRYFFGLAIIAGLTRFLPYIGPLIAWTTYGLVAYFQGTTIFGLSPIGYALFVVALAWLTDVIIDNFVSTRVMADALAVHPAAILVAALIGANLLGVAGMILAAPVLATIQLLFRYVVRKLFDKDPWDGVDFGRQKKSAGHFPPWFDTLLIRFKKYSSNFKNKKGTIQQTGIEQESHHE
jgi:predicted PurR-regulated permease PerM